MTKLKLIKKITSDWFDSHKFVNQVYWGDFIRWYADKQIQHSSVVITPIRVTEVTRSKRAIQLQITYADRVYSDFRNLDDVHSDADRTLSDFILSASNDKELRNFLTGLTSGNIEYFTNRTGDLVAGATMSVSLNVFSDANSCEIPVDFKPQPTPFVCAESNYTVQYENGTLIEQGTIPSGGSVTVEVPDIPTCANATWELRDTDNNLLDSGTIASGGSATITAPDATVNIQKSDNTLIASVTSPSGGVEPYNVADSTITVNGYAYTDLKATDSLNIPIVDSNGDAVNTTVVGSDVQVDDLPAPKDLTLILPYSSGDTSTEITIIADSDGTIDTATTTGLTSVVYEVNSTVVTLPFALAVGDDLVISFDSASADGQIKLEGEYV
jgi:hypothetical protein